MTRTVRRMLVAAAIGAGLAAAPVTSASAVVEYHTFQAVHSGKCLDVTNKSTSNNAKLQQYTCHGEPQQLFTLEVLDAAQQIYKIRNAKSGKCLDVVDYSLSRGARIQQFTCHDGTNQRWRKGTAPDGVSTFRAVSSELCLSVKDQSFANNAQITQETCLSGNHQRWILG